MDLSLTPADDTDLDNLELFAASDSAKKAADRARKKPAGQEALVAAK